MRLTAEQRDAVSEHGHVCLVSCPGSGKTRVIIAKLLQCIDSVRDSTRRIACVTHTNAAADEIDYRLRENSFSDDELYYEISTIHGFALHNILGPFHHLLTEFRAGFTVLTSDMEPYAARANELMDSYGLNRATFEEFERVQRTPGGGPSQSRTLPEGLQREWFAWLDENAYVTLNEMVYHSGRLVSSYPHIASALASRFAWILVDEFQDSSPGQILILKEIYRYCRTTFFCVGDPNQSIYRFAGASPELLSEFADHIEANTEHRLTGNFRSSTNICAHAERLCPSEPPMVAVGDYAECDFVPVHQTVTEPLRGILDQFLPAVRALGVALGKVAILAPSWFSLYRLAQELRRQNIPVIGPGSRPYKRSHLIAQLVECIGAYLESPGPEISLAVQRALFVLLSDLTGHSVRSVFDFKGRIAICKILAEARGALAVWPLAADWIVDATDRFSRVLIEEEILSRDGAVAMNDSAAQMAADIQGREGGNAITIDALGIFARPQHCIQLLTVHKAKGREFEAVALIDVHDGRFPHFSINDIPDEDERQAQYDESRRVVYVAATRAMRLLMFFSDRTHYKNRPTPFLAEMGL
jgi:DNA helicase II / ATP-dependent DNA helicase PcrA